MLRFETKRFGLGWSSVTGVEAADGKRVEGVAVFGSEGLENWKMTSLLLEAALLGWCGRKSRLGVLLAAGPDGFRGFRRAWGFHGWGTVRP